MEENKKSLSDIIIRFIKEVQVNDKIIKDIKDISGNDSIFPKEGVKQVDFSLINEIKQGINKCYGSDYDDDYATLFLIMLSFGNFDLRIFQVALMESDRYNKNKESEDE